MNENLDDLISAHREGVRLTGEQHARNRARLLSRVAAGVAVSTAAAGASTSTAIAATSSQAAATTMIVKVLIGLAVAGGAGAAYYASRPAPHVAVAPAAIEAPAVNPAPAAIEPIAVEPAVPAEPVADIAAPSPRAAKPSASSSSSLGGRNPADARRRVCAFGRSTRPRAPAARRRSQIRTRRSVRRNDG